MPGTPRSGLSHRSAQRAQSIENQAATLCDLCELRWLGHAELQILVFRSYRTGATLMNKLRFPQCGLSHIKRNGLTHYGKQNYRCKDCDRQFVEDSQRIGKELKDLIKVLLLERLSLRGICRVTGVSFWLSNSF